MTSNNRILNQKQVEERVTYSRTQIWRLEKQGAFPPRLKLGPNRVGWLSSEIDKWIEDRALERGQ